MEDEYEMYVGSVKDLLATEIGIHLFSSRYPEYLDRVLESEVLDENENNIIELLTRDNREFWEWYPHDVQGQADYMENFAASELFLEIADAVRSEIVSESDTLGSIADALLDFDESEQS